MIQILIYPSQYEHINRQVIARLLEQHLGPSANKPLSQLHVHLLLCNQHVSHCYLNYCLSFPDSLGEASTFENNQHACGVCYENQSSFVHQLTNLGAKLDILTLTHDSLLPFGTDSTHVLVRDYILYLQFCSDPDVIHNINDLRLPNVTLSSEEFLTGLRSIHSVITSLRGESILTNKDYSLFASKFNSWIKTLLILKKRLVSLQQYSCCYIFNGRFQIGSALASICNTNSVNYVCFESGHQFGLEATTGFFTQNSQIQDLKARSQFLFDFYRLHKIDLSAAQRWGEEWLDRRVNKLDPIGTYKQFIDRSFLTDTIGYKNYDLYLTTSQYEYTACKGYRPGEQGYELNTLLKLASVDTCRPLVIRLHPNSENCDRRYFRLLDLRITVLSRRPIEIIPPNNKSNTYSLIRNADIVFVSSSITAIESVFLGKPTFSTCWATYSHLVPYLSPERFLRYSILTDQSLAEMSRDAPSYESQKDAALYSYYYNYPCVTPSSILRVMNDHLVPDISRYSRYYHYRNLSNSR